MYYHLFISGKRLNAKGLAPIYVKLTINGQKYERSTKVTVPIKYWNTDFKRVLPNYHLANELNDRLSMFEALLIGQKFNSINEVDLVLYPVNKNKHLNKDTFTLQFVVTQYLVEQEQQIDKPNGITFSTYRTYTSRSNNLLTFIDNKPRNITEMDNLFAKQFTSWGQSLNFSNTYINKHIKLLKTLVRYSHIMNNTPVTNLLLTRLKEETKPIIYLTDIEVNKILRYTFTALILQKVADLFLLQCFTGLTYNDLFNITPANITNHNGIDFLAYKRTKTDKKALLPYLPQAKNILDKYNFDLPKITNQTANRCIKEIASIVGIDKFLTTHVGRKTFATSMLNNGVSLESTTKMLGKSSQADTQKTYAEVLEKRMVLELPHLRQTALF